MPGPSLTGIFSPGSPALVESLRTLVLTPQRTIAPGEIVRADFTFSNLGGAPATGVRVRFAQPLGAVHLPDHDQVDDRPPERGHFTDAEGAFIGDLEPGAQRRVSCSFRVDDTIEDATELLFQAALVADQTPIIASNVERIVVRSRPNLQGSGTMLTLAGPETPRPGDVLTVRATIENTGSASAHDVIAVLPVPEHTAYVPRSARIGGRPLATEGEPFDYASATVVAERLAPGQSVIVEYHVAVESPLEDGTRIKAIGAVSSREVPEFALQSSEIVIHSPVDFDNDQTSLTLFSDDVVAPGTRIPIVVRALNTGSGTAYDAAVAIDLPAGLVYAPGTAHIDGQPLSDAAIDGLRIALGDLVPGRTVEVGCVATVAVPNDGDRELTVAADLRWRGGGRSFTRRLTVRAQPRFHRARNFVRALRGVAQAGEDVLFAIQVYNDGTAAERNARLRLIPGAYLEHVRIAEESGEPVGYGAPLDLGVVEPHRPRRYTAIARIATPVPDRASVTFGAVLEQAGGAIDLGTATVVVRSRPRLARESVAWEMAGGEPLRPQRTADIVVRFTNDGTDVLRDARMMLSLPEELVLERALDARRDRTGVSFGDVPAKATHEARLTLRLLRPARRDVPLVIEGVLYGRGVGTVQLPPLEIPTLAQPSFSTAELRVTPAETVTPGERVVYEVRLRNDGDGPAERLVVRVVPSNLLVYVPSSTTINGMPIPDDTGTSQLWSGRGLVLADIDPGVAIDVRFETVAIAPLPAGTTIETRAVLEWDGGISLPLTAPVLRVEAQPALVESTVGTPISIARVFPVRAPTVASVPPQPEPEVALPSPAPVATPEPQLPPEPQEISPAAIVAQVVDRSPTVAEAPPAPVPLYPAGAHVAYVDFSAERLAHALRMLDRTDAGGLIPHLFALRTLFPEQLAGASADLQRLAGETARSLRAPLDRLFVRLRMPRLALTGKDIEDRESRDALRRFLDEMLAERPTGDPEASVGVVRVIGAVDFDAVRALAQELAGAPLGAVTPWLINAHLIGTAILHDDVRSDVLGDYRAQAIQVLTVLSELPLEEFHRVLVTSANRDLDRMLAATLDGLRAAAHLAVD